MCILFSYFGGHELYLLTRLDCFFVSPFFYNYADILSLIFRMGKVIVINLKHDRFARISTEKCKRKEKNYLNKCLD